MNAASHESSIRELSEVSTSRPRESKFFSTVRKASSQSTTRAVLTSILLNWSKSFRAWVIDSEAISRSSSVCEKRVVSFDGAYELRMSYECAYLCLRVVNESLKDIKRNNFGTAYCEKRFHSQIVA